MKVYSWLLRMPGRWLLPALMFAFALLAVGVRYAHQMRALEGRVLQTHVSELRERLSLDQSRISVRLGLNELQQARQLVAALAMHDGLEQAYLVDAQGTVRASFSRPDYGRPLADVLSGSPSGKALSMLEAGNAHRSILVQSMPDGQSLRAYVPLDAGYHLLVWESLARPLAEERHATRQALLWEAVGLLAGVAVVATLLHLLWFRRAQQLSRSLAAIGAGNLAARSGLFGNDELAHIGAEADRMAAQLQQDQQRMRHLIGLIDLSPVVVIEWANRPGWPVLLVSEGVRQWGYEPQALLSGAVHYYDLIHPDDGPRINAEVQDYLANGPDHYRQEYRIRRADGTWAWVDDRTSLTRDDQGLVVGISGVLLDITAQKAAELARQAQDEQLRMFFELPFLGMAVSSPVDKRWLRVNDRLCEILGYSREELLNMNWAQMTPPGDLERNVELFDDLLAGRRDGYRMAKRYVRKDGSFVHTEIDVRALRHPDGSLQQLFATIQDVSERRAAEQALLRMQEQSREAERIGHMGSWAYDLRSGEVTWSEETFRIQEQDPQQVSPSFELFLSLIHPEDRDRVVQIYQSSVEQAAQYETRYRILLPDGRIKHLHVRGETQYEDGEPRRSFGMVVDETELVEAQRDRDRLISVMETTSDIVSMATPDGRVFYFNRAGYELLGLPPSDPLERVIERVHPPWAAQRVLEEGIPTAMREGKWLGETAVYNSLGVEVPMSQLIMVHRGKDGAVEYLWTILRDISERKAAEAALELERTQLAQAQAVAHVGSWTLFPADRRLIWSDEHFRVLGYEPRSVEPSLEAFFAAVYPDDRAMVQAHLERDLQVRVPSVNRFEHRIVTTQGVRHVEQRASLEVDEQGRLLRIIGTTMDTTEQVLAEQALREAKSLLEEAEAVAMLGSWSIDTQTQWLAVSHQLLINLGLAPASRPPGDEAYLDRIHPDDRAMVADDMRRIRGGGPAHMLVFRTNPAHGPMRWLRRTARRIGREAQGLKPRYIGTLQDITDAVQAEEALRRANAELEQRVADRTAELSQANQELEAFSYTVSHDLKAPLRGIDGYSQLLLEDYGPQLDEEGRSFVQRIRNGVQLMGELISDLLDYSRMERRDMAREPVDLPLLVQQVLEGYEADIRRQGVAVLLDLPPCTLELDREGMAVVLRNLIGNAIKFSRDRQKPQLDIGSRMVDDRRQLWVRDNGVGFEMKYHDRMFGIFQRLHRAEEFPGTGVGLALVAKAVQRMGGRVWAESTPGNGATFYLEFPA